MEDELGFIEPFPKVETLTSPPVPEKTERRGRPKGSTNEYRGILTKAQIDRIRGRNAKTKSKEEKRRLADEEKKRRALMKAEASAQAILLPVPQPIIRKPDPPPAAKKTQVKDAIERCIVLARAVEGQDKTKIEALLDRAYLLAMDQSTDLEDLLKVIQFIAERMEGKPTTSVEHTGDSGGGKTMLQVNIATRFSPKQEPKVEIRDVTNE